jgi:hypothetical protein
MMRFDSALVKEMRGVLHDVAEELHQLPSGGKLESDSQKESRVVILTTVAPLGFGHAG